MHRLPFGGFAIDTPGIRGFGVVDMEKNEIYHFFPRYSEYQKSANSTIACILMNRDALS